MAQDDYYYEIQLTNKQLVFYFMAGAAGLILSFLAGVMVGRGVEGGASGTPETRALAEDRVVAEQAPAPSTATPPPAEFSYPQRLESDRPDDGLERPRPGGAVATPTPAPAAARPAPPPRATPTPAPAPTPKAASSGSLPRALSSSARGFALQVGAFKDRASADGLVRNLKARGFPAYSVTPPGGGLYTVRVGVYRDRADAEVVEERLREYKPFIQKQ